MHSNHKRKSSKSLIFFIVLGVISVIWFFLRVIPKPSRISYPCQRVAAANAVAFLTWLFGTGVSIALFKGARKKIRESRLSLATILIILSVITGISTILFTSYGDIKASIQRRTMAFNPQDLNQPVGEAKGIYPGRVAWAHNPNAISYDPAAANGYWWEDQNTDPLSVDSMFTYAIDGITGATRADDAWDKLFRHKNIENGKGDIGYAPGEKIAIKVNLVMGLAGGRAQMSNPGPSPQLLHALVEDLIWEIGVPGQYITVYDVSARIPDYIMKPFKEHENPEFREVRFVGNPGYIENERYIAAREDLDTKIHFADSTVTDVYLVKSITESDYLINFTNMKSHTMAGITICAKNLYGSIYIPEATDLYTFGFGPNNKDDHSGLHRCATVHDFQDGNVGFFPGREMGTYNYLVDIMGHPEIYKKTILYVVDALYSGSPQNRIIKFRTFRNDYTASVFLSQDPVAIESVCLDFLRAEPNCAEYVYGNVDNYLHEASQAEAPPSGMIYNPGGADEPLQSLGVHEHWNNPIDKQYSRNLETGEGIELVSFIYPYEKNTTGLNNSSLQTESAKSYPNPFNNSTTIEFKVREKTHLKIGIFDSSGRHIIDLANITHSPGIHKVQWNAVGYESGIYYCRITTDNGITETISIIKN